jgi:hypothetical protein
MPAQTRRNQTAPLVRGDLTPRYVDTVDLRNDNAGTPLEQLESILLRYLETALSDKFVSLEQMFEEIGRHYPFQGTPDREFLEAVKSLREKGLLLNSGSRVQINKVARVTQRYLSRK